MRTCYTLLFGFLLTAGVSFAQTSPRLIINEFLADPAADLPGDANGDGTRSASGDEFVELANVSADTLDLTGWMVGDDEAINFTFPAGYKLPPREIVVIFGSGDASTVPGYDPDPLLTRVFDADSTVGNGFANGGDFLVVKSADGNEDMWLGYNSLAGTGGPTSAVVADIEFEFGVDVIGVAANEDVSVTRNPDGNTTAENPWVKHTDVSAAMFSPGTTIGGLTTIPKELPPLTIIINEVLADPASGTPGDANLDGARSASEDEFVELANVSDGPVDLTGWRLGDDEGIGFTFPDGYVLGPREIVVVFGGGNVSNVPGYSADPLETRVFSADSTIGNGLANGGEAIILLSPDNSYDQYLAYGSRSGVGPLPGGIPEGIDFEIEIHVAAPADADNSITRFPDGNVNVLDPFVQHLQVSDNRQSPGSTVDGRSKLPPPQPPITILINEVLADAGAAGDANGDGATMAEEDQFIEIVNVSEESPVDLSGYQVGSGSGLTFTFPDGYMLAPRKFVAVFGGGDVSNVPGYNADPLQTSVFSAGGSLGSGLDASGDFAVLVSPDGAYDAYVAFGSASGDPLVEGAEGTEWEFSLFTEADANQAQSITRDPDAEYLKPDPFVGHLTVSDAAFSPAATVEGLAGLDDFVDVPHPWGEGHVLHYNWWERDRVEVREAASLMPLRMDQGTIEMWFRPDSLLTSDTHPPDWTYLFSKNLSGNNPGDVGLGWERGEGRLVFFIQDGTNTTNLWQSENINEIFHPRWYHVAATWNTADSMRLFIDGKKVGAVESAIPVLGGEMAIAIGGGNEDLWNSRFESFRGSIDEVRFSVVERYTDDFELQTEPFAPDEFTLALWHFDEGTGEETADATGNGFTGYLGGFDAEGNPDPASAPSWMEAVATAAEGENELPDQFELRQNFPNPFNPVTTISYKVPKAADVELSVFNVLGQRVRMLVDQQHNPGTYTVDFRADDLASGVYFYVLKAEDVHQVRKMVLLK